MNPLLSEAQQARVAQVRAVAQGALATAVPEVEASRSCPEDVLTQLMELVDAAEDLTSLVLVVEELARVNAGLATVVGAHGAARLSGAASAGLVAVAAGPGLDADEQHAVSGNAGLVAGATYAQSFLVAVGEQVIHCPAGEGARVGDAVALMGLRGAGHAEVAFDAAAGVPVAASAGDLADTLRVVHAARAVGLAQGALDAALSVVSASRDSGDRIDRSQSVQWMLADIATAAESARVATYHAAAQPAGAARAEASAMSRLLAAEGAVAAARSALQIAGEQGAREGSEVARLYRDAKLTEIEGGSNEAQLREVARHLLPDLPAV